MSSTLRLLSTLVALLFLGACKPKTMAPAEPVHDAAAERRQQLFGERAKAADITWRSSGLGIRILAAGEGTPPRMSDVVRIRYRGLLKDGTVFDESSERAGAAEFAVNRLIPGWAAAMPAIKPGGRAEFFIPPSLGYGGMKVGKVPPNSGLIFEIELLAVNPQ